MVLQLLLRMLKELIHFLKNINLFFHYDHTNIYSNDYSFFCFVLYIQWCKKCPPHARTIHSITPRMNWNHHPPKPISLVVNHTYEHTVTMRRVSWMLWETPNPTTTWELWLISPTNWPCCRGTPFPRVRVCTIELPLKLYNTSYQ